LHTPLVLSLSPFLDLSAIFLVIGALTARLWIFTKSEPARPAADQPETAQSDAAQSDTLADLARDSLGRILTGALVLLTLTTLTVLLVRTAEMSQQSLLDAFAMAPTVVQKTHYGAVWLVRVLALGILWLAWALGGAASRYRCSTPITLAMLACASVIAWSYSATGHAADRGDFTLQQWIDLLHVMAGALWAGTILATAPIMRKLQPWTAAPNRRYACAALTRLSRLATWVLLAVLASGGANAVQRLGAIGDLWTTNYGLLLVGKVCLVLAMIGLGALNRFYGLRRILAATGGDPPSDVLPLLQTFRARLRLEAGLALAVLLCVSVLIHTMPPTPFTPGRPNPNPPPPHHTDLPSH
jgi:putative copper export protein